MSREKVNTMPILMYIGLAAKNAADIESFLEQQCGMYSDGLLGKQIYETIDEVLFVVQLADEEHINYHLPLLTNALRAHSIRSFEVEEMLLLQVSSMDEAPPAIILSGFPLLEGESWFPARKERQHAYLSLHESGLNAVQAHWLQDHQLAWREFAV
jgi:hypothetical protein